MRRLGLVSLSLGWLACGGGADTPTVDAAPDAPSCGVPPSGWSAAPPIAGGALQETAAVALGGKVYVLGGFDRTISVVDTVWIYDPVTCAWSAGPPLPRAVHHANAIAHGDTLYVLGALTGRDFAPLGEAWAWTPGGADAWRTLASLPAGRARGSAAAGAVGDTLYLAGGLGDGTRADVLAYDPIGDRWLPDPPSLPAPREHACGAVVDGRLYVLGGRQGGVNGVVATSYALTPGAGWQTGAPMPTARGGVACGVVDGGIVVVGGEGNPDSPSGVFDDVERYDPAADTWQVLAPMPTPRHGMAAAGLGPHLFVPAGATQQLFGAVDTHEILTP